MRLDVCLEGSSRPSRFSRFTVDGVHRGRSRRNRPGGASGLAALRVGNPPVRPADSGGGIRRSTALSFQDNQAMAALLAQTGFSTPQVSDSIVVDEKSI